VETTFQALIMGIVQGLTEFLPVSSSGHLVIVPRLLGWTDPFITSLAFSVMLHLGTLVALLAYFRADWLVIGSDGSGRIDVRAAIELDDGAIAYATYNGRLNIPPEVAATGFNRETAEKIDPSKYYFRTAPTFETASEKYSWLNRIQAISVGRITRSGVAYSIYEVL